MTRLVLVFAALTLIAAPLFAQATEEDEIITITPKEGGWKIEELLVTIAEYTGQSIVYDPQAPQIARKTIAWVGAQEVPKDKLFEWFQSLLSFQRLILVPVGPEGHEQWMVLDLNATQITNRPIFVPEDEIENWSDRDGVYIVSTITVKNMTDTSRARNALAQLSTRQIGRINDVPGNSAFVVADFAPVVASMYRLLRAMDVRPLEYTAVARTYPLKNAVAEEMEPILINLLSQAPRTRTVSRGRSTPQGVPEKPEPQIIADTRQDAIIVFAIPEDQDRIAEIIELLDQEVHYKRGNIHYRPVKHSNASELADLLTDLISGTGGRLRTPSRTTPRRPGSPGPTSAGSLSGAQEEPIIVADDRTNGLLIQATSTQMKDLDDLIAQIDVPRNQVLVEAALVELSVDDLIQFGVELKSATTQRNPNERTAFAGTIFGLTSIQDSNGDQIPDINIPNASPGIVAGIYDDRQFPLVLQALSNTSQARALSIPSVVVEDGSDARMTVSDEVPYQIRSNSPDGTTNFSVEFTDAEITLDISPHISSDNYLRLHLRQTVQSFRAQTNQALPPPKTSREIETDIVIPDGYTVIMGGLINENKTESRQGVPYLEDIPLLGYLFQAQQDSKSTTSLFLFVTPHILRHDKSDFTNYHEITWKRKLLADKLLGETIAIHEARFKLDPKERAAESEAEKIEESGFTDVPRYHGMKAPPPRPEEWRRRFEEARMRHSGEE